MLLQIPLDIPDVTIEKFNTPTKHGFVITVASKQKGTLCQHCGKFIDQFYGHGKEITLRHLPILEKPVWIKIKPKRYQCSYCDNGPTTTQECSWYIPKSPHTKAFEQWLLRDLINSTIIDVSMKRGIGKAAVDGIINRYIHDSAAIFAKDCFGIHAGQSAKITRQPMPAAAPAVLAPLVLDPKKRV